MNEYEPDYVRQLQSEIAALKAELENQVDPLCYTQHELIEVQFRRHYEACGGNCTETADSLGISRMFARSIRNKMGLPAFDRWGKEKTTAQSRTNRKGNDELILQNSAWNRGRKVASRVCIRACQGDGVAILVASEVTWESQEESNHFKSPSHRMHLRDPEIS